MLGSDKSLCGQVKNRMALCLRKKRCLKKSQMGSGSTNHHVFCQKKKNLDRERWSCSQMLWQHQSSKYRKVGDVMRVWTMAKWPAGGYFIVKARWPENKRETNFKKASAFFDELAMTFLSTCTCPFCAYVFKQDLKCVLKKCKGVTPCLVIALHLSDLWAAKLFALLTKQLNTEL